MQSHRQSQAAWDRWGAFCCPGMLIQLPADDGLRLSIQMHARGEQEVYTRCSHAYRAVLKTAMQQVIMVVLTIPSGS